MQTSVAGAMEQPPNTRPKYQISYLEENKIGNDGYNSVKKMCKDVKC